MVLAVFVEHRYHFLESDEVISTLFSCINLTVHELQETILGAFHALCQSPAYNVTMFMRKLIDDYMLYMNNEIDNLHIIV